MDNVQSRNGSGTPHVYEIDQRAFNFAVRIVRLTEHLDRRLTGQVLARQLLRCGTSVGANIAEAQAAQSRADFVAKMSIAHKELCESEYWLRLIEAAGLMPADRLAEIRGEAGEIGKILTTILKRTKSRAKLQKASQ